MQKTQISILNDGASYQMTRVDSKTGKVADCVTESAAKILSNAQVGQILTATVKSAGSRRDAFVSFLGLIYQSPRLDGFKGTGDTATGKLSSEFKAAVRDVEGVVVSQLVAEGAIKLPKTGNAEENMQAYLSGLRDDKNYSNVKNTTNKFFALCGQSCTTPSGYIVPVTVMQATIADAVEREDVDKSVSAKLRAVVELMNETTIDSVDAIDALYLSKQLVSTLEGIVTQYAELATAQRATKPAEVDVAKTAATIGQRFRVAKTTGVALV